jgi:uncharacterized iron-regulated membrane protein
MPGRFWRLLAFVHRWLGIAGALLFLLWFASGIVMMYVRMPEVTPAERLEHARPIDAAAVTAPPADARAVAGAAVAPQIEMLGDRPVYRFGATRPPIFADTLEPLTPLRPDQSRTIAMSATGTDAAAVVRYLGALAVADQWTIALPPVFPLHHFALDDSAGTEVYVSARTGEVVMQTTRRERVLGYLGPVAHWLYVPVLRRNGPLWTRLIVWSSIAGCLLALSGLVAGIWRLSPSRRFRLGGVPSLSPYAGWMKWHHYAGLLFGVFTFTWIFSGLLSMDPFAVLSSEGVTPAQRAAVAGQGARQLPNLEQTKQALDAAARVLTPKSLALAWFRDRAYWLATDGVRQIIVPAANPESGTFERFDAVEIERAARDAAPVRAAVELTWLNDYDEQYYDRYQPRPLPVLRARYSDPDGTWMYLDPARGAIALVVRRPDRVNRWLYHGLHSLDPAWLRNHRPLWDLVVIALSIGGFAGVVTSVVPAWRRLRRRTRR